VPRGRITVRDVLRILRDNGWKIVVQRGSHRQLKHPKKPGRVTVASKSSAVLPPKTLRSIMKQAGLEEDKS
jgi:predicted RNA binding protein YcfA (HicA-like mRNA interferase family)